MKRPLFGGLPFGYGVSFGFTIRQLRGLSYLHYRFP